MSISENISSLLIEVVPISSTCKVDEVADMFLEDDHSRLLSLPVVDNGEPVGIISRYQLMKIFLARYGRELYGKRPISSLMNKSPLLVDVGESLEASSQYITRNIQFPITEDFIIVKDGLYSGMGVVLDLLRAIEGQLEHRAKELESANRSLKSSQAQLVQSEKMASLGQMVAGVAHEINTPLGYVRNNVEMAQETFEQSRSLTERCVTLVKLLSSPDTNEEELNSQINVLTGEHTESGAVALLEDMQILFKDTLFGIEQISELVLNLKDFSRLDRAKESNVNLNECLDSVLVIAKNILKNRIEVVRQYGLLPSVSCASSQINQVFLNILTNAAQAIDGDGKIQIQTDFTDGEVHISIRDTGKGMPPDVLSRIFDPFFTTKPVGQGTGLGLSISYQIVQQHGGRIHAFSTPGKGTKFVISLPVDIQTTVSSHHPQLAQSA